jgi:DNA-binding beta-propeller fold protein YncE
MSEDSASRCSPGVCVAAVLGDEEHRVAVLGGREGMPRSLGSVYGGSVTRFLGGSLRGVVSGVIDTHVVSYSSGVAVSVDGCTLLLTDSDAYDGGDGLHDFSVADGTLRRVVCELPRCSAPSRLRAPRQVCIAPDGFVFVADGNDRIVVLTPALDFHSVIGAGRLARPFGVCANADVVVVVDGTSERVMVFRRGDGALLRWFGSRGSGDGRLHGPRAVCFMSHDSRVAVADCNNNRVSVFSVDGEFIRHVGVGVLKSPEGVACSAFDELVVADTGNNRVIVFGADGELATVLGSVRFGCVTLHHNRVFAHDTMGERCIVFE